MCTDNLWCHEFALPDYNDDEAIFLKLLLNATVTLPVGHEFLDPEVSVSLWHGGLRATFMMMPVTSVNEDCPSSGTVGNVRGPWQIAVLERVAMAEGPEQPPYCYLRFCILLLLFGEPLGCRSISVEVLVSCHRVLRQNLEPNVFREASHG